MHFRNAAKVLNLVLAVSANSVCRFDSLERVWKPHQKIAPECCPMRAHRLSLGICPSDGIANLLDESFLLRQGSNQLCAEVVDGVD